MLTKQLAMATLTALFGGVYSATGSSKPKTIATPPINASTSDEADFIKYVSLLVHQSTHTY